MSDFASPDEPVKVIGFINIYEDIIDYWEDTIFSDIVNTMLKRLSDIKDDHERKNYCFSVISLKTKEILCEYADTELVDKIKETKIDLNLIELLEKKENI
ncbi:MAG: hypothetical protein MJ107_08525 [Lachnospiraceae bacterium]|nr:hypothetical protein [Lachnospiraceae bacterium]